MRALVLTLAGISIVVPVALTRSQPEPENRPGDEVRRYPAESPVSFDRWGGVPTVARLPADPQLLDKKTPVPLNLRSRKLSGNEREFDPAE